jgi:hypothetical protein
MVENSLKQLESLAPDPSRMGRALWKPMTQFLPQ